MIRIPYFHQIAGALLSVIIVHAMGMGVSRSADGTETEEEQLQVSAGYALPIGIGLDVAYKRVRNAGVDTDVFGALLAYTLEF